MTATIELTPERGQQEWASNEWEEAEARDPGVCAVKRYVETNVPPGRPKRQKQSFVDPNNPAFWLPCSISFRPGTKF